MTFTGAKIIGWLCFMFIYLLDSIICETINDTSQFKETFIIRYFEGRKIVPVKVDLDIKHQTEVIQTLSFNNTWVSISFHDFRANKVAYKDIDTSQCFISSATLESIENHRKRLKQFNNGIVKGSFIPTIYILKDIDEKTNISKKFGARISEFCNGTSLSYVSKDVTIVDRKKRQTLGNQNSDGRDKFTHHSYGHYGHQSNNYAHYGHDTHVTGTVDKNGIVKDSTMAQYQERSQGSQSIPMSGTRNLHQRPTLNQQGHFSSPFQSQNTVRDSMGNSEDINFGRDNAGRFSLQTAHESGYQLNLPLGLRAGNTYRSGISSTGRYGQSEGKPYHFAEQRPYFIEPGLQAYPSSSIPGISQATYPISSDISKVQDNLQLEGSSLLSPSVPKEGQVTSQTDTRLQYRQPSAQTGFFETRPSLPSLPHTQQRRVPFQFTSSSGTTPESQIKTVSSDYLPQIQPGIQKQTNGQGGFQTGKTYHPGFSTEPILNGRQVALSPQQKTTGETGHQFGLPSQSRYMPGVLPRNIATGSQPIVAGYEPNAFPGTTMTGSHPGLTRYQPTSLSGSSLAGVHPVVPDYQLSSLSGTPIIGTQTGISGYQPSPAPRASIAEVQPAITGYQPSSFPQTPVSGYQYERIPGSQSFHSGYTESRLPSQQQQVNGIGVGYQAAREIPGISPITATNTRTTDSRQVGLLGTPTDFSQRAHFVSEVSSSQQYSASNTEKPIYYTQPHIKSPQGSADQSLGHSADGRRIGQGGIRTGSGSSADTEFLTESRTRGGDFASSQTQIQTGVEGTGAEASSSGQYRGIGSKTQVQGGYAGNGSFSAQAQSGFTGGITQSQVQGGKQGGLSGSSAVVENVGSAQSQVQIGKPSGSASSTAQGRFSSGMTNVKAQSGRTGGSAGAASQSKGLSSSQVQVDIAGKEATGNSDFQGTVSASVLGSHSSGQSQTQLQGGYDSGRTYAATAQGGFDAMVEYQNPVISSGSSPIAGSGGYTFPDQVMHGNGHKIQTSQTPGGGLLQRTAGNRIEPPSTLGIGISGQNRNDQVLGPEIPRVTDSSEIISLGSRVMKPSSIYPSTGIGQGGLTDISLNQDKSPERVGTDHRIPVHSYPPHSSGSSQRDISGHTPMTYSPQLQGFPAPVSTILDSSQTQFGARAIPISQQQPYSPNGQPPTAQSHPGQFYGTPSNSQGMTQPPFNGMQPSNPSDMRYRTGYEQFGLQQPLPDSSQRYPHLISPGTTSFMQPSYPKQPDSPEIRTQNGLLTSNFPNQFGQPTSYHRPYVSEVQNGDAGQTVSTETNQFSVAGIGGSNETHLTRYPPPGQYQPSPQMPDYIPQLQVSQPTGHHTETSNIALSSVEPTKQQPRTIARPGAREPHSTSEGKCCEALKNLRKRCCGRTSPQSGSCCSQTDDITQDFEEDDIPDGSDSKEPCKVVKAICYIVYKPVGKARICKPTNTNSC